MTVLLLLSVGCDSKSGKTTDAPVESPKPTTEFAISGAVDLFPAGANVFAYPVVNGRLDRGAPYGVGITDASGHYQLTLQPGAAGETVVIEAVAAPGQATLRCPLLKGCNGEPFGATLNLSSELTVSAPVRALKPGGSYNLSLITTALAKSLEDAGIQDHAEYVAQLDTRSLQLADRFEVFGELTQQSLTDWTQLNEVQAASIDALRFSGLAPAAVTAWCSDNTSTPVETAFAAIVERLARQGLAATARQDVDLNEIAMNDAILDLAAHWQGSAPMTALISERRAANAVLSLTQQPFAQPLQASSGPANELASTKKFVDDIRQAGTSINQKQLDKFRTLGDLLAADGDLLKKMGLNVDGIDLLNSDETDRFIDALSKASSAMLSVLMEHLTFKPISSEVEGVKVSYTDFGDFVRVGVNQSLNGCDASQPACPVAVNINLDVAIGLWEASAGINFYRLTRPDIKLFGILEHEGSQLVMPQSDPMTIKADEIVMLFGPDPGRPNEDAFRFDLRLTGAKGVGPFSLRFAGHDERIDSDYQMALGASSAEFRYNSFASSAGVEVGKVENVTRRVRLLNTKGVFLDIAGKGEDPKEAPQFGLSIALDNASDGAELQVIQTVERECTLATQGECVETSNKFETGGEDAPPPLGMTATALGRAKLDGYAGPVWLKFSGSRADHNAMAINFLTVSQPGHGLWLNGEFNDDGATQLEAYNRQGYYFDIHRDGSMRSGGVYSPAGALVVELKDMGSWIKLTYPDGTFDSI